VLTDGQDLSSEDQNRLSRNSIRWRDERIEELVHVRGMMIGIRLQGRPLLAADALFFNTGQRTHCDLPKNFGCSFDSRGLAATSKKQKTEHPGVFIAGDADGDVQFVIVAAAEGATAALAINRELQDEDRGESDCR
jgi:thioredoxin reductase